MNLGYQRMNDLMTDDKLVSSPPRDYLLGLRRDAVKRIDDTRLKEKIEAARAVCDYQLNQFAGNYFFDHKIYGALKPKEKNELAEIYAFSCRKRMVLKTLPFAGLLGIITGFGIWNPITLFISFFSIGILIFFGGIIFSMSGWGEDLICGFMSDFKDCWKFISARRFLRRVFGKKDIFEKTGI